MELATESVLLDTSPERSYAWLSELAHVPEWATEFAREFRIEGDRARLETPGGPATMTLRTDAATGVIDFVVRPDGGGEAVFPSRVVGLPDGRSAYVFVVPRSPGQSEERFREEVASLRRELENVRAALR